MVQNVVSDETLDQLKTGINIKIREGVTYLARPTGIEVVHDPRALCQQAQDPREQYPHTWLLITLTEGKHRQVRKMVLAARHRCLRLIRISMAGITLGDLLPGQVEEMEEQTFCRLTGIRL
jgi:23S rRNA pseudouridine2457 synthase